MEQYLCHWAYSNSVSNPLLSKSFMMNVAFAKPAVSDTEEASERY